MAPHGLLLRSPSSYIIPFFIVLVVVDVHYRWRGHHIHMSMKYVKSAQSMMT